MTIRAGVCVLLGWLVFVSCASPVPREHIVMFAADGSPVDPADTGWFGPWFSGYGELLEPGDEGYAEEPERSFDDYVENMVTGIRRWTLDDDNRRVLLFIHGGMNSQPESVERAQELSARILADGAYPVFINWRSSLMNCYADHLFFVRQGSRGFGPRNDTADDFWDGFGVVLFPFQLAADLVRGIVRFPIVALNQLEALVEWQDWGRSPEREAADEAERRINTCAEDRPPQHFPMISQLEEDPKEPLLENLQVVAGGIWWFVMLPVKAVTTITVDAGGQGAWQVMRRRVDLLFHREDQLTGEPRDRQPRGLLYVMERLHELQQDIEAERRASCRAPDHTDCGHSIEITLVGHSMGAIVLNQLLAHATLYGDIEQREGELLACRGHGDEEVPCTCGVPLGSDVPACCDLKVGARPELRLPRFRDLVYLAAACSVREYQDAAFPYLEQDTDARAFHVVLHPRNERGENFFFDVTPRGSLLTWVDDFLAKPLTPLDRTAGSYSNLLPTLYATPRELRPRIHVRVLPWADDELPQAHSDFNGEERGGFRFWDAGSWYPGAAE